MLSFQTGKIPKRVRDDIKHFGWHKEQIVIRNFEFSVTCPAELAAKSVETMSKRDFMPLPDVSASYR